MTHFIVRVEGVNFPATLYDTNDLSVIRGASLMLDGAAAVAKEAIGITGVQQVEELWSGASETVFRIQTDAVGAAAAEEAVRAALAKGQWRHLSFVVDAAGAADTDLAIDTAEARNRTRQFRQWTVPDCRVDGAWRQCAVDGMRGATAKDPLKGWVSEATMARLQFGRVARRKFFLDRLGTTALRDVEFCDSFEQLVGGAPLTLPDSVRHKVAVVHFDGDGFGKAARSIGRSLFSSKLAPKLETLLRRLVDDALEAERQEFPDATARLRMETLVWGGDDVTIVVPAWRALDCIAGFMETVDGWEIDGHRLGFTAGAVIAHYKAPVRQLKGLAEEAVWLAKGAEAHGSFTLDIYESAALPEDGLDAHRRRVFGADGAPRQLAFPGAEARTLCEALLNWRSEAGETRPSRGKLIDALAMSGEADHENVLDEILGNYGDRVLGDGRDLMEGQRLPMLTGADRPLALDLRLVLDLWDYAAGLER